MEDLQNQLEQAQEQLETYLENIEEGVVVSPPYEVIALLMDLVKYLEVSDSGGGGGGG